MIRATEGVDQTTKDLDVTDSAGIVKILGSANSRIFADCFGQSAFLEQLQGLVGSLQKSIVGSSLAHPTKIIMSGAGTSGRLAFVAARGWTEVQILFRKNDFLFISVDILQRTSTYSIRIFDCRRRCRSC